MGLQPNSLEPRDGAVKFALSDLACHNRNVPSLCFHQAVEAIRGGWQPFPYGIMEVLPMTRALSANMFEGTTSTIADFASLGCAWNASREYFQRVLKA